MADIGHILDKPPSTGVTYFDEEQENIKVTAELNKLLVSKIKVK